MMEKNSTDQHWCIHKVVFGEAEQISDEGPWDIQEIKTQ
jgi:hypothetical protein